MKFTKVLAIAGVLTAMFATAAFAAEPVANPLQQSTVASFDQKASDSKYDDSDRRYRHRDGYRGGGGCHGDRCDW